MNCMTSKAWNFVNVIQSGEEEQKLFKTLVEAFVGKDGQLPEGFVAPMREPIFGESLAVVRIGADSTRTFNADELQTYFTSIAGSKGKEHQKPALDQAARAMGLHLAA